MEIEINGSKGSDFEGNIKESDQGFRLMAVRVFLTYPKCSLEREELLEFLDNKWNIKEYYISRELHKDGTPHLHAALYFSEKIQTRRPDDFDVKGFHPNIQPIRCWPSVVSYVCKNDKKFITNIKLDLSNPNNFKKRKDDFDEWINHRINISRNDIDYPIKLPNGVLLNKPDPKIKKRHVWLIGPPDWGKTYWVNEAFNSARVFVRSDCKYPFEDYDNEDIIIYDDFVPQFSEIASVSNTYKINTKVFGDIRYKNKYWANNHTRTMIILTNFVPDFDEYSDAVVARFNFYELS